MDQGLSPVEHKVMDLIKIFYKYTVRVERGEILEKKELRELLEKKLPNFLSMLEEDAATNILNQSKEETSLEDLWDMIIKMGLEYYEKMQSNAV